MTAYSPEFEGVVIANSISSVLSATFKKTLARSESWLAKNPTTATSRASINVFNSSAVVTVVAGGPVFLFSQEIISASVLPPVMRKVTLTFFYKICNLKSANPTLLITTYYQLN